MFYPASRPNVSEGHGQWPFSLCGIHGLAIEEGMANILQRNSETAMLRRHSGLHFLAVSMSFSSLSRNTSNVKSIIRRLSSLMMWNSYFRMP